MNSKNFEDQKITFIQQLIQELEKKLINIAQNSVMNKTPNFAAEEEALALLESKLYISFYPDTGTAFICDRLNKNISRFITARSQEHKEEIFCVQPSPSATPEDVIGYQTCRLHSIIYHLQELSKAVENSHPKIAADLRLMVRAALNISFAKEVPITKVNSNGRDIA